MDILSSQSWSRLTWNLCRRKEAIVIKSKTVHFHFQHNIVLPTSNLQTQTNIQLSTESHPTNIHKFKLLVNNSPSKPSTHTLMVLTLGMILTTRFTTDSHNIEAKHDLKSFKQNVSDVKMLQVWNKDDYVHQQYQLDSNVTEASTWTTSIIIKPNAPILNLGSENHLPCAVGKFLDACWCCDLILQSRVKATINDGKGLL